MLTWLPGHANSYCPSSRRRPIGSHPGCTRWFHFRIKPPARRAQGFAVLTAVAETGLTVVLPVGVGRRLGYAGGARYAPGVRAVWRGGWGPYPAGTTNVGTGTVYTMVFVTLLASAPPARRERFSLDRRLGSRRQVAEPHAVDRRQGALVEPVVVEETAAPAGREREPSVWARHPVANTTGCVKLRRVCTTVHSWTGPVHP